MNDNDEYGQYASIRKFLKGREHEVKDTGERISDDDEGPTTFGILANRIEGKVIIVFKDPVAWFGMSPEQARLQAEILLQHADALESQRCQGEPH